MRFDRLLHPMAFSGKAHEGTSAFRPDTHRMTETSAPSQAKRTPDFIRYLPLPGPPSSAPVKEEALRHHLLQITDVDGGPNPKPAEARTPQSPLALPQGAAFRSGSPAGQHCSWFTSGLDLSYGQRRRGWRARCRDAPGPGRRQSPPLVNIASLLRDGLRSKDDSPPECS